MKRIHRVLLSFLSGVLLSLAWIGFPGWTLFIALVPLLFLDDFFVRNKNEFRGVSFFGHVCLSFLLWNLITTWWIAHATVAGAAMAIVTNTFLMSVTWWLAHSARRKFKANLGYFALVFFWISFEYFHYHWDIEWPWLQLGNGFANNVKMIQWYEFTGVFGGTLWVLLMNILLFKLINFVRLKTPIKQSIYTLVAFNALLILPLAISFPMYFSYHEKHNPKEIVVVQPNVNPYSESYDLAAETQKKEKFISLVRPFISDSTDFVVGPETVFENPGYWNEDQLNNNRFFLSLANFIGQYKNAELVFGISSFKVYRNKSEVTKTARKQRDIYYDRFNTAIFIGRDQQPQIYHKSKLVVGVEKMPFIKYLGFIKDLVINIGGTTGSLGRQKESSVFVSKDGTKVAPVICYESVFGEYVASYVKKGAGLIFIITNDGWWKKTAGYKQHLSYARLRAVETRRSIARSGNTGISCFINQRGDVLSKTKWWTDDAIKGRINLNDKLTFYVRHGDYIARISLFMSVLLLLYLIVKRPE